MRVEALTTKLHLDICSQLESFWGKQAKSLEMFHHPLFPLFFQDSSFVLFEENIALAYLYGLQNGEKAFVHMLAVRPKFYRKGYASFLLLHWEKTLQARGIHSFYAYLLRENALSKKFFLSQDYMFLETIEAWKNVYRDMYCKQDKSLKTS